MLPNDERVLLIRALDVVLRPYSWTEHQLRASTIDANHKVPPPDQVSLNALFKFEPHSVMMIR